VQDAPAVVGNNEEAVQEAKRSRWNGEEVHRGDGFAVVSQESKPAQRWFRLSGARFIQREMVGSETSKPNIKSSPWIRGAPQVGFSATIRNITSRISFEILSLPADLPIFESSRQYQRKPARCHRITVSGLTRMRGCFHEDQRRRARSQKILSTAERLGRGCFRFNTASCCRSTRFSMIRSRRERKERTRRPSQSGNIDGLHSRCEGCGCYPAFACRFYLRCLKANLRLLQAFDKRVPLPHTVFAGS
jgi:hypothetical protein